MGLFLFERNDMMVNSIFKTYEVTVDTMRDSIVPQNMRYSQNDLKSAKILININHNGNEEDFSEATAVRVSFEKGDKKIVYQDCQPINVLEGKYQVLLTTQTLTSVGIVTANVHIYFPDDKKIETGSFKFEVVESKMSDEVIESTDSLPVIQKAIEAGEKLSGVDIPALVASKETAEQAKVAAEQNAAQIGILSKDKANKTDVRLNNIKLGQTDMTEEFLQQMAGNTPINAVPADDSLTVEKMKFLNVVKANIHNSATDTNGQYINGSGGLTANVSWKASDYIPVTVGKIYTNSSGLQAAYYDSTKKFVSMVTFTGKTYTVPNGVAYVRHTYLISEVGVLCEGPTLLDPNAEYGSRKVSITDAEYKGAVKDVAVEAIRTTEGKSGLFFGDSILQTDDIKDDFSSRVENWKTNWPTYTIKSLKLGKTCNYGKDGAGYRERPGLLPTQWVTNQILDAIAKKVPADIIVMAAGTNDGITDVGDFETAMSKTKLEDLDKTKLYEAIRWCYWTLRLNYPNAMFYAATPTQRTSYSPQVAEPMTTAIKKMANYYNFIIIDAMNESGIVREFEVQGGPGRYLSDGLHPNEAAGKQKLASLFTTKIKNTYVG